MSSVVVKQITNPLEWERFLLAQSFTPFVQSSHYGDFYIATGESYTLFGVYDAGVLIGGSLVVTVHARRGTFLYIPYGPVIAAKTTEAHILPALFESIYAFAIECNVDFIRVSPFEDDTSTREALYRRLGFVNAPMHILAETTWLLDITDTEEVLLAQMNKNHRNLIRRCEREGVSISTSTDKRALEGLDTLLDITAERHKFIRFSREYIEKEFEAFAPHGEAVLFEARLPDGTLDSAAVIMFFGTMAAYRHSASLGKNPKLPSSYALQWAVIREAKRRGIHIYNFWGIAPDDAGATHPFYGITHFKKGFGGSKKQLLHCQDLPVRRARYAVNWSIETFRRIRRGF